MNNPWDFRLPASEEEDGAPVQPVPLMAPAKVPTKQTTNKNQTTTKTVDKTVQKKDLRMAPDEMSSFFQNAENLPFVQDQNEGIKHMQGLADALKAKGEEPNYDSTIRPFLALADAWSRKPSNLAGNFKGTGDSNRTAQLTALEDKIQNAKEAKNKTLVDLLAKSKEGSQTNTQNQEMMKLLGMTVALNAGKNAGQEKNLFMDAAHKEQGNTFAKAQDSLPKLQENVGKVDDAMAELTNYMKAGKTTGPAASGFGARALFDKDTEKLNNKFKDLNIRNMVQTFNGMSKAVDTGAERQAWDATQAGISNRPETNKAILLGTKSLLLKEQAERQAQKQHALTHGDLDTYVSPVLGQTETVVSPDGEMKLVPKKQVQALVEQGGYLPLNDYIKGATKTAAAPKAEAMPQAEAPKRSKSLDEMNQAELDAYEASLHK